MGDHLRAPFNPLEHLSKHCSEEFKGGLELGGVNADRRKPLQLALDKMAGRDEVWRGWSASD